MRGFHVSHPSLSPSRTYLNVCIHAAPCIVQVLLRASDFAFFLLTGLEKPAFRSSALAGRPFEMYMELFRGETATQMRSSGSKGFTMVSWGMWIVFTARGGLTMCLTSYVDCVYLSR